MSSGGSVNLGSDLDTATLWALTPLFFWWLASLPYAQWRLRRRRYRLSLAAIRAQIARKELSQAKYQESSSKSEQTGNTLGNSTSNSSYEYDRTDSSASSVSRRKASCGGGLQNALTRIVQCGFVVSGWWLLYATPAILWSRGRSWAQRRRVALLLAEVFAQVQPLLAMSCWGIAVVTGVRGGLAG